MGGNDTTESSPHELSWKLRAEKWKKQVRTLKIWSSATGTIAAAASGSMKVCVRVIAVAELPTRFGRFRIVGLLEQPRRERARRPGAGRRHRRRERSHAAPLGMSHRRRHRVSAVRLPRPARDRAREARERAARAPPLSPAGGTRYRAREQDPGLRAPGQGPRYRRGQPGSGIPRRRARLRHRGAHDRESERPIDLTHDQQSEEDRALRPSTGSRWNEGSRTSFRRTGTTASISRPSAIDRATGSTSRANRIFSSRTIP